VIYDVDINGKTRRIEIQRQGQMFIVSVDGRKHAADVTQTRDAWSLILSDLDEDEVSRNPGIGESRMRRRSYEIAIIERAGGELTVHVNGRLVEATVASGRGPWARRGHEATAGGAGPHRVTAPMPGKVVKLLVKTGDTVVARQGVVVVEAMKMENELRTPKAGTVTDVRVAEGTSVEAGAVLLVVE
jgi:biotin carboxyl carrier protein